MSEINEQKNHRYSLKKGFIGPLTKNQTKQREYNKSRPKRKRNSKIEPEYDNYFDCFVDGRG